MAETLSDRVRRRVRDEMIKKHLSQRDLAGMLEMNQSDVSKLLNGITTLTVDYLERLCFGVNLSPCEAVRDQGLEFCAELTPTELRVLEKLRERGPEVRQALYTLLDIKVKPNAPERHAGPLEGRRKPKAP